jgi:hypothetical protein
LLFELFAFRRVDGQRRELLGSRLMAVYGKVERLASVSIGSEADKAAAIRSIRSIKANGRFTDLGAALDAAKRDMDELGQPERPGESADSRRRQGRAGLQPDV